MAILDKVISLRDPGDGPSPHWKMALKLAPQFTMAQFLIYGKPEHLEQAINRHRVFLNEAPPEDPDRIGIIQDLSHLQSVRLHDFNIADIQNALSGTYGSTMLPSFRDLLTSLPELKNTTSLPNPDTTLDKHLDALQPTTIELLTDIVTIEDGIKYCRQLLVSYPRSFLGLVARSALPNLFHRAFECTNEIEYLNEAISAARDHFNTAGPPTHRRLSHLILIESLSARLELLHHREDLDELMQLFAMAAKHENVLLRHSPISWNWVWMACRFRHPSASTAYDCAISSMQIHLATAPTLDVQYSRLVTLRRSFETVPLGYASFQIHTGRLKQAIETVERGRALLWSELRGLRTSMDQIRLADSHLADKFTAVNRDLERLTFDISLNDNFEPGRNDPEDIDLVGRLEVQKQRLLDDRDRLISQIQALPGFNNFLRPPSFDTLHWAACRGPVIVINYGGWCSDILILLHNSPPSLIPTSDDFHTRAAKLQDQLLRERRKGLESDKFEDALRSVLKELYDLVGRPVIKRLNELNVPEQSRVWWCPTSLFCSLPLHAMGPIPSDMGPPRYFLDVYISSYTPSLSALIESHKPGSQVIGKPSILLVAQPDGNMPQALKEMKAVQDANTQVTTLFSEKATPNAVLARLRDHPFAHIVCHGILAPEKPFETSFKLHRGKRLQLLDIVQSQLPNAEFAFLSACHTAELTDESMSDEVLHLTAAMQFCGFRSVVGTMWAMADIDGRDLARDFYESVFAEETQGAPYYERTAKALRDAVKNLRRKGGMTLERWVNFVHYGA
jgi:CHAT domain-containing protein